MDDVLKELMDTAVRRGNRYIKGEVHPPELSGKLAELGVFLLEKARKLEGLPDEHFRIEVIEIQNKVDDIRKALFACKIHQK